MISFESSGSFKKTDAFLAGLSKNTHIVSVLEKYGRAGVAALSNATPAETGLTAESWDYEVQQTKGHYQIFFTNHHTVGGIPVAVLIQYGHGTGTGGYVTGRDFINPVMRPIFDKMADEVWKAVTSA